METQERINKLRGSYKFKSPYHKKTKWLPFVVIGNSYRNDEFKVDVKTVSYRGWDREDVFTQYTIESIEEKISNGSLIAIK